MSSRDRVRVTEFGTPEAEEIRKALLSEQRMRLLGILSKCDLTVGEVALALGISQPNASVHVRVLEQAGLITTSVVHGPKGTAKACSLAVDDLVFQRAFHAQSPGEQFIEVAMPVGLFTAIQTDGSHGWVSADGNIREREPNGLFNPERVLAQVLWLDNGWVEYTFSAELPPGAELAAVDYVAEICSEAPPKRGAAPSDLTVWINGHDIGTWTSPADFTGERGLYNPHWWSPSSTQHGVLKTWTVDRRGSYIDGEKAADVTIGDLRISPNRATRLRLGVKEDAVNRGGLNLFGRQFGNYPQDPILRYRYRTNAPAQP